MSKAGEPSAAGLLIIEQLKLELLTALQPLAERHDGDKAAQCIIASQCLHVGISTLASYNIAPDDLLRCLTRMVEELRTTGTISMYVVPQSARTTLEEKKGPPQ